MPRLLPAFLLAAALAACNSSPPAEQAPVVRVDGQRFRVDLFDDDLALGGNNPLVTIVVFSDYACPPCGRTWQVMDHLVEDYGEDLRVVMRTFTVPGFSRGEQAAEAALAAAAQGKFWEMHRQLFADGGTFDRPILRAHAETLGLDVDRFLEDLDTGVHSGRRVRHRRQAKTLGIRGLPAIFVNGLFVAGFHDEKTWHGIVDGEIERARARLAEGVQRADLYAETIANGASGPVQSGPDVEKLADELAKRAPPAYPRDLTPPDPSQRYDIPLTGAPSLGPVDAPVVVVQFVDFRCPYCRRAWQEEITKVRAEHPDDVRLVIRQLPLEIHPEAHGAAIASLAADRHAIFPAFHEKLWAHEGAVGRQDFVAWAAELGVDEKVFAEELDDVTLAEQVAVEMTMAARLGITGTPAFFVNGRFLSGFRPGALGAMVDEELAAAAAKTAEGVPRAELSRVLLGPTAAGMDAWPNPDR